MVVFFHGKEFISNTPFSFHELCVRLIYSFTYYYEGISLNIRIILLQTHPLGNFYKTIKCK